MHDGTSPKGLQVNLEQRLAISKLLSYRAAQGTLVVIGRSGDRSVGEGEAQGHVGLEPGGTVVELSLIHI